MFQKVNLKLKLTVIGSLTTLVPLLIVTVGAVMQNNRVTAMAEKQGLSIAGSDHTLMIMVVIGALLASLTTWYFIAKGIDTRLTQAVQGLREIVEGDGDLTKRLAARSNDETGELAHWFNRFIEKMQNLIRELTENASILKKASSNLDGFTNQMSHEAQQALEKTKGAMEASQGMSTRIATVASTMQEAAGNINIVASSAEEMNATINEIASNTEKARGITNQAVQQSSNASNQVGKLGDAAKEIGKVVETITEISEQVNLLALNATIEAARAGDAGRGFAVVANEIKELARQTASATGEIKMKVEGIQNTTNGTVKEIENINHIVIEMNNIVTGIASALEEQSVTTNEIAGSVSQASTSISEVSQLVSKNAAGAKQISEIFAAVGDSSKSMSQNSGQILDSTSALRQMSEQFNRVVGRFRA
jgi:methyl-accepting chemotaxis protein